LSIAKKRNQRFIFSRADSLARISPEADCCARIRVTTHQHLCKELLRDLPDCTTVHRFSSGAFTFYHQRYRQPHDPVLPDHHVFVFPPMTVLFWKTALVSHFE
jgi:hypothetical protein